jgi:NAD(P)H dehydrogenase (quinone)
MKVLTIYAHHNPRSFCRAVLEKFSAGLRAAGHEHEIVDLHAINFDPVLRQRDSPDWMDETIPDDVLASMQVPQSILDAAGESPVRRWLLKRWMGGADARGIVRKLRERGAPEDVATQQDMVARADGLVFIAPIYFSGFPAILKGWIERVLTLGFAYELNPDAWHGDIAGRRPLLHHTRALVINTTLFDRRAYEGGLDAPMKATLAQMLLDFKDLGQIDHVSFYAVHGTDEATRQTYLEQAYALGRDFATPAAVTAAATHG